MAITLDGTNGITTPDVNSDGLTVDSTTLVVDETNNRVGIGTSSPTTKLDIVDTSTVAAVRGSSTAYVSVAGAGNTPLSTSFDIIQDSTYAYVWNRSNTPLLFATNNTERARIDTSGNLLVGTASVINVGKLSISFDGTTQNGIVLKTTRAATGSDFMQFFNSAGSVAGKITHNGTTTVAYTTSSDYRLKENVVGVTGAAARVQQLNPVRFNFIADPDTTVDGFLAHEVQDVVPEAIVGTKDAVDAEGNPDYQGIDQSKLVPLLTAALQEALTKIDSLETRIAALEAA